MRVEVILVHATKNRYYRRFERQHRWKCVMWFVCVCVCVCVGGVWGLVSWNTRGSQPLAEEAYHQWNIVLLGTSPKNM